MSEAAVAPIRPSTGLVLFPTKALAHDQLRALTALELPGIVAGAYDGDASPEERTWVRKHASLVLTNPEMLHSGILPHHERWATFLGRLRFVVLDELHTYRGVFGSHVAQLVRRLRRLAAHHGAPELVFIGASATVGAPHRLAAALTGAEVTGVVDDGSPQGARTLALWEPPVIDERSGARASAHRETAAVMAGLIDSGRTTLGFARSRRAVEVVAADLRRRLPRPLSSRIRAYRGGYLAEERRAIEDELFGGHLSGVVATSALELGIDVGGLDAVVIDGFPGTISSFRQQAGRAGRSGAASVAVLVAGDDQLDRWLVRHPRAARGAGAGACGGQPVEPTCARPPPAVRCPRAAPHPCRRAVVARRGPGGRRAAAGGRRRAGGAAPRTPTGAHRSVGGIGLAIPWGGAPQLGRRPGEDRDGRRVPTGRRRRPVAGPGPGPRRRVLPPPGPAVAGGGPRPGGGRGPSGARRRRHVHRAQAGHGRSPHSRLGHPVGRAQPPPPGHRRGGGVGGGLPAQGQPHRCGGGIGAPRPPGNHAGHQGPLVRDRGLGGDRARSPARCPSRRGARRHRDAPPLRHLRSVGRRRASPRPAMPTREGPPS